MSIATAIASAQTLDSLGESRDITLREILAGDAGTSLAQMVNSRAAIQFLTKVDARQFCRIGDVGRGGGLTYHFQKIVAVTASASGEPAADITLQDPTDTDVTATATMFRIATFLSDLAMNQSAVDLAGAIGAAQGSSIRRDINNDIFTTLAAATTNTRTVGASADGITTNYVLSDIMNGVGQIERQRGESDTFATVPQSPKVGAGVEIGWYPFVNVNQSQVQFTASLAEYLQTGRLVEFFGQRLYLDKTFDRGISNFGSNNGDVIAAMCQSGEAIGWAQVDDLITRVQRWELQVGTRIVTHATGKSARVIDEFCCAIKHA
jgi:hypothetical protein